MSPATNESFAVVPAIYVPSGVALEEMVVDDIRVAVVDGRLTSETWVSEHSLEVRRLMDKYFLLCTRHESTDAALEKALFERLAESYEEHIDVSRNRDNMRRLFEIVRSLRPTGRLLVFDWGCGPGVAIAELRAEEIDVVGVDTSVTMLHRARAAGLTALTPEMATTQYREQGDAVLAGYLLHLPVDRAAIELVRSVVSPGGIIAANFHKGVGLARFNAAIGLDSRFQSIDVPGPHPRHGSFAAYRRT